MEEWRDIPEYEDLYEVSDFGRVRRFGKILKNHYDGRGYYYNALCKNGKRKCPKTHQLVAMVFLGHKPDGHKLVINHIDGDTSNNAKSNLEIVTPRVNSVKKNIRGSSKYVGVSFHTPTGRWRARACVEGREQYLGLYDTEILASEAYQKAVI